MAITHWIDSDTIIYKDSLIYSIFILIIIICFAIFLVAFLPFHICLKIYKKPPIEYKKRRIKALSCIKTSFGIVIAFCIGLSIGIISLSTTWGNWYISAPIMFLFWFICLCFSIFKFPKTSDDALSINRSIEALDFEYMYQETVYFVPNKGNNSVPN